MPQVDASPAPVQTDVQLVDTDIGPLVGLVVHSTNGTWGFFLSPDHAAELAGQLGTASRDGRLIVPNGQLLTPEQ
jgi:hypothetical protein